MSLADRSRYLQRIYSVFLRRKSSLAALLCALNLPVASAASTLSADFSSAAIQEPIFSLNITFDQAMLGLMALYMLIAWVLRAKTPYHSTSFHVFYAFMRVTGLLSYVVNRDELAIPIRTGFVH
jgi:hypothetical protein